MTCSLLLLLLSSATWPGQWPIPASRGGVFENLDRGATGQPVDATGALVPSVKSEMDITITDRSRPDVTVVCRTRGEFFNHDLPRGQPDPNRPRSQCAQVTGEKASERIEDTSEKEKDQKKGRRP